MCFPAYIHHVINYFTFFTLIFAGFFTSRPVFDINYILGEKNSMSNSLKSSYTIDHYVNIQSTRCIVAYRWKVGSIAVHLIYCSKFSRHSRQRRPPCWFLLNLPFFDMTCAFFVLVLFLPPNLVSIGPIVKEWQQIFEIQDCGVHHLDIRWICTFNAFVAFYVTLSLIPSKFGEDWCSSKEMATDFRNSRWRRPPSWILVHMYF